MARLPPSEIADRDARRLALVLQELGGEGAPIDSGWMACDLPGSWAVYAAGLGLEGKVEDTALDALVAFYRERERPPRILVTPYQHPSLLKGLAARGFTPYGLETALVRGLTNLPPLEPIPHLEFRRIDPSSDDDVAAFRDSQTAGFFEDKDPPTGMLPITERVARSPRASLWLLELEGRVVGSGGLEHYENSAVLFGGCIEPGSRRRGLHSAFTLFRLQQAELAGLHYVTVASIAGGPTERNALRAGFGVAYTQIEFQQV
ncbi:MAG: hypothetical protein VX498_14685 [Myxococcota bacterium]|nr:hypothetical protein [Myxococcota bacterium]